MWPLTKNTKRSVHLLSPPSGKPIRNKAARFVNDVEILYLMMLNEIHFKTAHTDTGGNVYQCVILFFFFESVSLFLPSKWRIAFTVVGQTFLGL